MIGHFILTLLIAPPWIPSSEIPVSVQKQTLNSTVRLVNRQQNNGEGTAVCIAQVGERAFYLTAAHNVSDSQQVELHPFDAEAYPKTKGPALAAFVAAKSANSDLALLWTPIQEKQTHVNICAENRIPKVGPDGLTTLMIGCKGGKVPALFPVSIDADLFITKPDRTRAKYWETASPPDEGCSGGPVVDAAGNLIGIVSGSANGKGYYVHGSEILRFLGDQPIKALRQLNRADGRQIR